MGQNHMEVLIKHRSLGPTSRISDPGGAEWGQGICISNKFPGDVDIVGPKCGKVQAFTRRVYLNIGARQWKKCILDRAFIHC